MRARLRRKAARLRRASRRGDLMKPTRVLLTLLIPGVALPLIPARPIQAPPGTNLSSRRGAGSAERKDKPLETALRSLLSAQAAAWNRGDIEGFMQGYWKSERTTFASSSGILRGWQALLNRYRHSYPDRAAMGRLEFSDLEITPLGPDAALVLGRWGLAREKDSPGGVFTLVARRFPEGWRIVHDHTSAVAPPGR